MCRDQSFIPCSRRAFLALTLAAGIGACGGHTTRRSGRVGPRGAPNLRVRRRTRISDSALVDVTYDDSGALYCTDDGGTLHRVRDGAAQPLASIDGRLWAAAVNADGRLAYGGEQGGVRVLEPGDRVSRPLLRTSQVVLDLAWRPDGRALAAGLEDGSVQLLSGDSRRALHGFDLATLAVAWSPSGRTLAAGSYAGEGHIWSAAGRNVRSLQYPEDDQGADMNGICWIGERALATASQDGSIRIWRLRDGTIVRRLPPASGWKRPVVAGPGGRLIVHSGLDGIVTVSDVATGSTVATATTPGAAVWGLAWVPSAVIAVAADDGVVRELGAP